MNPDVGTNPYLGTNPDVGMKNLTTKILV